MFLPLSQQLCQSQGHRCHRKATSYFGPSTNQIHNTEAPYGERACWASIGPPAAPGALWLIRQIRKRALWMKTLQPHRSTHYSVCSSSGCPLVAFWGHFVGFCPDFQPGNDHHVDDEGIVKTRSRQTDRSVRQTDRQTASVRTLSLQEHRMLAQTPWMQATMMSLKEWRSVTIVLSRWQHAHTQQLLSVLTLTLTFERQRIKCLRQRATNKTSGVCVSGRQDSEKWDFLSASRLQLFWLQMHLGLHEWVNQGSFDSHWLHTLPSHHLPTPSLWHRVSHAFYHSLIANIHAFCPLAFRHLAFLPSFSPNLALLPALSLDVVIQLGFLQPRLSGRHSGSSWQEESARVKERKWTKSKEETGRANRAAS